MERLVLETAIGPVLPFPEGWINTARWLEQLVVHVVVVAVAMEEAQGPAPDRAAKQGPATS